MKWTVYKGVLSLYTNGEEYEELHLKNTGEPLSALIREGTNRYGRLLSVRYYICDMEIEESQIPIEFMKNLYGSTDAKYRMLYTECTGYLWTDDYCKVGGHDLINELKSHVGKYLWMSIHYEREKNE